MIIGRELQRKKVIWAGEFLKQLLDTYFSSPLALVGSGSAAAAQLAVPSLPCPAGSAIPALPLALWSGALAVPFFLSISVCPVLTLLLMFCACAHLHSQLFLGPIYFFTPNHVPVEVFNVNRQV